MVTNGGLMGTIYAVTEKVVTVEVANGVRVRILKSAVQSRQGLESEAAAPDKDASPEKKEGK